MRTVVLFENMYFYSTLLNKNRKIINTEYRVLSENRKN